METSCSEELVDFMLHIILPAAKICFQKTKGTAVPMSSGDQSLTLLCASESSPVLIYLMLDTEISSHRCYLDFSKIKKI